MWLRTVKKEVFEQGLKPKSLGPMLSVLPSSSPLARAAQRQRCIHTLTPSVYLDDICLKCYRNASVCVRHTVKPNNAEKSEFKGPPPLSQDLDLRSWKLCLGNLLFLVKQRITFVWWRFIGTSLPNHDLTSRTKDLTPRSLQQLITPLPHLSHKRALLKAFGGFGGFKTWATHLLAWPCKKPFSVPNSNVLVLLALTVRQTHGLAFQ